MTNRLEPFNELYRRIEVTTKTRYNAAQRLKSHHRASQWTVTLLSVALVAIPLSQAFSIRLKHQSQLLDAIEVFLAVLILAYSLLLGNENYSGRAEKMLNCGLELGRLGRKIYPLLDKPYQGNMYEELSNEYDDILEKHDNHDPIDHEVYKTNNEKKYYTNKAVFITAWLTVRCKYMLGYWHYALVSFGVVATCIYIFLY